MFLIEFSKSSEKQFLQLPREIQERIKAALERTRIRPKSYFEMLVGSTAYKLRVGDHRVIADIEHDKLMILAIEIGHRRNIYKK